MFHAASSSGDTWGVPGPLFAVLYPVVTIALVVAARWLARLVEKKNAPTAESEPREEGSVDRERMAAPRERGRRRRRERIVNADPFHDPLWRPTKSDPSLEEIAYLSNPILPIDVALAELLLHGAIKESSEKSVTFGSVPDDATDLQRAIHASLTRHSNRKALAQDPAVGQELSSIRESLQARGYLRSPGAAVLNIAAPALVLFIALIVGYRRYNDGETTGMSVDVLMWEITAVLIGLVATLFFSFSHSSRTLTKEGQEYLDGLQKDYAGSHEVRVFAKDDMRAPYAFTPARAPLSVALFGTGAIHELYPDAAETLHIPLHSQFGSPDGPSAPAA